MRYHINGKGEAGLCRALKKCPYGSPEEHFSTEQEARNAYEHRSLSALLTAFTKKDMLLSYQASKTIALLASTTPRGPVQDFYDSAHELIENSSYTRIHRLSDLYRTKARRHKEAGEDDLAQASYVVFKVLKTLDDYRHEKYHARQAIKVNQGIVDRDGGRQTERYKLALRLLAEFKREEGTRDEELAHELEGLTLGVRSYNEKEVRNPYVTRSDNIFFSQPAREDDLREALAEADSVYLGKLSAMEKSKAYERLEAHGQELITALSPEGTFELQKSVEAKELSLGPVAGAEGFELIAGGTENNIYLHKPTMMVYKVRHGEGLYGFAADDPAGRTNVAVLNVEKVYSSFDKDSLATMDASYLKTYFLSPQDASGKSVSIIAQPYLDPERYEPYAPTEEETAHLVKLGLSDLHEGNMSIDVRTGKVVLYDCIYASLN